VTLSLLAAAEPGGILVDFLTNPGPFFSTHGRVALGWLRANAPVLVPPVATAVMAAYVARRQLLQRRTSAFQTGALCVEVLAPPVVAPKGGEVLWAQLSGLLRP
jgi:hypothetical protein